MSIASRAAVAVVLLVTLSLPLAPIGATGDEGDLTPSTCLAVRYLDVGEHLGPIAWVRGSSIGVGLIVEDVQMVVIITPELCLPDTTSITRIVGDTQRGSSSTPILP